MKTNNLEHNQLSPSAYEWYLGYLNVLDEKDLDAYGAYLADDCVMITNNQPPVEGKQAIMEALKSYWATFGSLEHDLLNIYGTDTAFMLEALNNYKRTDGQPVTARAVAFTDRDDSGQVTSVRLYSDTSALFENSEASGSK